jgi:phosphate:Na+ symporter
VVLFISRQQTAVGRIGRVLIGLGLMLLALRLVSQSTQVLTQSEVVRALLASINSDLLLEITVGAVLALLSYSSLAIVLLTATLAPPASCPGHGLGLVLGANLGSGLLACSPRRRSAVEVRQVPLGNLVFKALGVAARGACSRACGCAACGRTSADHRVDQVVLFHLAFNLVDGACSCSSASPSPAGCSGWLPKPDRTHRQPPAPPGSVGAGTPSLAISCAAREALHQADIVETMLLGMLTVIRNNDLRLAEELRKLDDTVDELYSAIKYYLTKISREALGEEESRRWTDIISFTINMEQIGDIIERILIDIEDKKIRKGRSFSEAGMAEICELHARLIDNLRLGMSVFLNGSVRDAQKLLEEKARFRDLEHAYAGSHIERLSGNTVQSIETSSLHIDLISDLKRINSHICSIAYPILDLRGPLGRRAGAQPRSPRPTPGRRRRRQARADSLARRRPGTRARPGARQRCRSVSSCRVGVSSMAEGQV